MKKYIIYWCYLILTFTSFAQNDTFNISRRDLEISKCPIDSDANAYYMLEKGFSFFDIEGNFDLVTEYEAKIKILNKKGFDESNIAITLYHNKNGSERISEIRAKTYNLEQGKVIFLDVDKKNIYTEKINDNYTQVKFTFPDVKEGSVIYYKYTIRSPFKFNFQHWKFQKAIPKLYSEFKTKIPAIYRYNTKLVGFLDLDIHESDVQFDCISFPKIKADCEKNRYVMKNIPAFIPEDYMLSSENYISQIEFELVSTQWLDGTNYYTKEWKNVDKDLKSNHSIGLQSKKSGYFKKNLPNDVFMGTELERAKKIYHHMQNSLVWNGKNGLFKKFDVKKTYEDKTGSVTALNSTLYNALIAGGINAKLMLLSTRQNGLATKLFPILSEFNYLIVYASINNKNYLLDISDPNESFGDVPFKCLNEYGRIIDFREESYWYDIVPNEKIVSQKDMYFKINSSAISGKVRVKPNIYDSKVKRAQIISDKENYVKNFESKEDVSIISYNNINLSDLEKSLIENIELELHPEVINNTIYFNPFIFNDFDKNPFQLKERRYPVDFGIARAYKSAIIIDVPEDYEIVSIPDSKEVNALNNTARVKLNTKQEGNKIIFNFNIEIFQIKFSSKQYPLLKKLFSAIITIQNDSFVTLKKK